MIRAPLLPLVISGLLCSMPSFGQWIDRQGRPIKQTQSLKSQGNFGVQIVLTGSEAKFRDTWNRSAASPQLESTSSIRRGERIAAMILFHGCAANPNGRCDGIVTFALISPDGTATPAGEGPLWTAAPTQGAILLSHASLTVGFDKGDRVGTYQVVATVVDRIAAKQIEVRAPFAVQ